MGGYPPYAESFQVTISNLNARYPQGIFNKRLCSWQVSLGVPVLNFTSQILDRTVFHLVRLFLIVTEKNNKGPLLLLNAE